MPSGRKIHLTSLTLPGKKRQIPGEIKTLISDIYFKLIPQNVGIGVHGIEIAGAHRKK